MASEPELSVSRLIERIMEMPFLSVFTTTRPESDSSCNSEHPDHESTNSLHHQGSSLDRIILINPVTQGIVMIGGGATIGFESLMNDLMRKDGQPPAHQTSIDAMTTVEIKVTDEIESLGGECVKNSSGQQFSRQWKSAPTVLYSSRL
ncbi:E3 ubiquitin-protein ligase MPSR1-like [Lactuca sativa]|uniref:E3 ubiquitin-protein ligase MPSR1-like n=1 Tax=Lactuca sativa TaxID=4236 RepID=UPI0022AEABCD|nr:E3 ubiquitin-protein ligase MPSR1-like [Lactuca sativa]XP_052627676.1 E3 ubiquitin-protein ligase MPSR1-like [Lactuca sativa]